MDNKIKSLEKSNKPQLVLTVAYIEQKKENQTTSFISPGVPTKRKWKKRRKTLSTTKFDFMM